MREQIETTAIPKGTILVVDLEATCAEDQSIAGAASEIIEIGACWIGSNGRVLDTFQSFVRPVEHQVLTPFCMGLTGIAQEQVDSAPFFPEVAKVLYEFSQRHAESESIWVSWGGYDQVRFGLDAHRHGIENPISHLPHANLKKIFAKQKKLKRMGMMSALTVVGIGHTGDHHRALDDAINVARLLNEIRSTN